MMGLNSPSITRQMQENILNATLLKPEINWEFHIISKKNNNKTLRSKIKMNPGNMPHTQHCRKHVTTTVPIPTTSYHPRNYTYPVVSEWPHFQTSLLTIHPMPVIIPTSPIFSTHLCPYPSPLLHPMLSPIVQAHVPDDLSIASYSTEKAFSYSVANYTAQIGNLILNDKTYFGSEINTTETPIDDVLEAANVGDHITGDDIIEFYLSLPKDLFPPARTFALDPNPIIDEFCKMSNIQSHTPWLLDLEFGIPKSPITRPIPIYNVKFNSIHCKNAPDAIHPCFETCDPDFKRVLLFYYDCVVSAWYRGYISMNYDRSVETFQSWLLLPMQVLGMCWP